MKTKFLTKLGEVAISIASGIIELESGARLPNVSDFCARFGVGAGTVQAALKLLEEEGAIELQARGHQGTVIVKIDRIKLWTIADNPWVCGAMPLPYTTRFEGLATALYREFDGMNLPFNILFIRGGRARIKRLCEDKFHFAICSRATAMMARRDYPNIEVLMDFGPRTYMEHSGVVFADANETEIRDGMKIGIDRYSYDHVYLNEKICGGKNVEYVQIKYSELLPKLENGEVDASLWNWDELQTKFAGKNIHLLQMDKEDEFGGAAEDAVLVTKSDNKALKMLLCDVINRQEVVSIQDSVLKGATIPSY